MPLAGTAFLALWNDILSSHEADYEQWHTLEHVPERVAVDGFYSGRRYVNRTRSEHRYFTLYDLRAIDVLKSAQYRDLIDDPTPASASMRPHFTNFVRAVCRVTMSRGRGIGGAIACLCVPSSIGDDQLREAAGNTLGLPRINAAHIGDSVDDAPSAAIASRPPRAFDRVVLVEALDRDAAADALNSMRHALALDALPRDFGADVYDLAFVFPAAEDERRLYRRGIADV